MKKIVLAGGAAIVLLVFVLVLGVFGYGFYLLRSINTPEFKKTVLERVRATVGADVQVKEMDISLLSGVTLKGVTVGNPPPFSGNLLKADAFILRYRILPLLSGRVEVEQLVLDKPVVTLAMNARGTFNYEKLGGGASKAAPAKGTAPAGPGAAAPVELILRKVAVEKGQLAMVDATDAPLMKVQDFDLDSGFDVAATGAQGSGTARIATLSLADLMFVRGISAPIQMSKESAKLAPIRGKLAGGDVSGDVNVNLKDGFRYTANLDVKGAQVQKLLEEAKSKPGASGSLMAHATVEGSGGLPTMKGKGRAEVTECKVTDMPLFAVLASVLRLPEVSTPSFDQCKVEFVLGGGRLQMTVIDLKGKQMQLTGHGTTNLETYALDLDMNLALAKATLDKVTVRELKAAFKERPDGFSTVDFKVTGTSTAPQTDLAARVGGAAAAEAASSGLKKLFGGKKKSSPNP